MKNPFGLSFGKLPENFIRREGIIATVMDGFVDEENDAKMYILTGVRGSGKTVMLNYLKKQFEAMDDWLVLTINPEMDILESIASKLYEKGSLKRYFLKTSFNFSFHGIGFSIEGNTPLKNIETLLEKMMEIIKDKKKKVLIAIDEISNSDNIKVFSHTFKNMVNNGLPIYLLATGLYENVYHMSNEKTLTFIYRAKKIHVDSLNLTSIAQSYKEALQLDNVFAKKCAALTEGYASAYQILGSILFKTKAKKIDDDLLSQFDSYLEEINYEKLWEDLSMMDKEFLYGIIAQKNNKAAVVIQNSKIAKTSYSRYRDRLMKKGIIRSDSYGYLSLTLPRLYEYIQRRKIYDEI